MLIGISASCFVMIVTQSAATARFYAARHHQILDENDDLVGLAAANAVAGLSGTFVVNGSPTQTAMVESSGGRSQVAQLSTAVVVALVLLFLTKPLQFLPRCVLGSIVFVIAVRLIDLRGMASIRRESPGEFLPGVDDRGRRRAGRSRAGNHPGDGAVAAAHREAHLSAAHRCAGGRRRTCTGSSKPPEPGATTKPGLILYRFGAPLFYANAGRFAEEIRTIVGKHRIRIRRWLVVDAEAITNLDYTAARVVRDPA